jgi:membrane dipeptidase
MHSHPGAFYAKGSPTYKGDDSMHYTLAAMTIGGLTGAFVSLVADAPLLEVTPTGIKPKGPYAPGDGAKEYKRQLGILKDLLNRSSQTLVTDAAELQKAFTSEKTALFLACEGSEFLEGKAEKVDELYEDGVRSIQLVHYAPNALGDLQTWEAQHKGLSEAGKEVVKRMNARGMVIDVAHASYDTVKAVVDLTTAPIILSHSILKAGNDRPLTARAITEDHAKLVAKTKGIIGAWPSGFNTSWEDFIDNTKRLIDVAGVDHVGLGTDMDGNFKPVLSSYTQLPDLSSALEAKGFSKQDVAKVMGRNMQRVLGQVVG